MEKRGKSRRWPVLAALGAVILLAVAVFWLREPKGRDLGTVLFGAATLADWDGTAVFLGDSITDLCDLDVYYPGLNAVNSGISGDTTDGMLDRLEDWVFAYEPDIVVVEGGINDLFLGVEEDRIVENLLAIAAAVHERAPDAAVIVQSIYPVADSPEGYLNSAVRRINARLEDMAAQCGYRFADVYQALRTEEGALTERYSWDGLHPNDAGYRAAAPVLTAALEEITGKGLLG